MTAQELKNSILMRAVQGKLVPQDPNDEPASVLLAKIRAEKEQMMKEGKIKKEPISEIYVDPSDNQHYEKIGKTVKCIEDKIPFEIPESWAWCRLNTLGEIVGGGTPSTGNPTFWDGDIAWLTPADMKYIKGKYVSKGERMITKEGLSSSSTKLMPPNTILYSSRAPIGYIAISQNNLCTNQGFKSLVPISINIVDYIYYCLIQRTKEIQSRATGTTFKEISGKEFGRTLIPIPPLNEQHQIVKMIDILMPYVEKYGFYECKRNSLDHMLLQDLKKSILQYAIQGKLVPQDPNDEPASVLLERIRAEKEQLIKDGKIKRDKNDSYIYRGSDNSYYDSMDDNAIQEPFNIPSTWHWAKLSQIGLLQTGTTPSRNDIDNFGNHIDFITPGDISNNAITKSKEMLSKRGLISARLIPKNSILQVCIGGSIGKCQITKYDATCNQQINTVTPYIISVEYLLYAMQSDYFYNEMILKAGGTATPIINKSTWGNILIPIPPLNEQLRLVNALKIMLAQLG